MRGLVFLVSALLIAGTAFAGSGGPDEFGYMWIDSDEPGGPVYNWVDISTRGTLLPLSDDDNLPAPFPFTFDFYGNSFSGDLRVCSNGWCSFTSTSTSLSNTYIPNPAEPNNLLAMFWDDLNPRDTGEVRYFANSDSLIVAWLEVPHYYQTGANTFEVILTSDGGITYQFLHLDEPLDEATTGIENADGTIGLQVQYNEYYLHDSLRIDFLLPEVMMSCDNLTPRFCRGKHYYFMLTINNRTGGEISGVMTFSGYAGYGCDSLLIAIPRNKTYPDGETSQYYCFKVPRTIGAGPYSASVSGTLAGVDLYCCMDVDIIECEPFRIGDNTEWDLVQVDRPELGLPTVTELHQNYPNPFNATTNICFDLAEASNVSLKVYDLSGRVVTTLVDGQMEAGSHLVAWDASGVSSGVYFYKLATADYSATKTMNLLK